VWESNTDTKCDADRDTKCYAQRDTKCYAQCYAQRDTKCYAECDTDGYSAASNTEATPDATSSADALMVG
jgi:hypothetical protein